MKKPIRVITQRSQSLEQYARDRKCATVMEKILKKWYQEDLARGVVPFFSLFRPTSFGGVLNQSAISKEMSSVCATLATRGDTPIPKRSKRGSKNILGNRPTLIYLDDLERTSNDIKKVRGNKSAGDEKNGVVPVLQEQGNPCGDCPFRHGASAGANSLREAFKAVSKRAEKRIKKTGEVK